jgi:hypothetical protein
MMKDLRILGPRESGKGILVEMDAGYVSPKDPLNEAFLSEKKDMDYRNPFEFYAVLQKYGVPNRNGRVYPERILKREADRYKTAIKKGLSTSELNHPDGHILMGKLKLLTSPGFHESGIVSTKGDIAANLMRQGVTMGVSSRGVGSLKKIGEQNEVQDDFELICFDLVSSPSTPGAYLFGNPEERSMYEENLDEEKNKKISDSGMGKSVDLMKKLTDYLNR